MKKIYLSALALSLLIGCAQRETTTNEISQVETHVLHAKDVDPLTPDSIISILKVGNQDFVAKHMHDRDAMAQLIESAKDGQHPMAIVLSCIDSRVPVEIIFDKGLGDLFVTRVAGNVVSDDILGSMEYACAHSGSKVVVVLGHENCGAVHAACEGVEEGNMTQMLSKIKPAIDSCSIDGSDTHSTDFQNRVVYTNVSNMVDKVREGSDILRKLEESNKIKIVGAVFNLHTGVVEFI